MALLRKAFDVIFGSIFQILFFNVSKIFSFVDWVFIYLKDLEEKKDIRTTQRNDFCRVLKFPGLFSVQDRWEKGAGNFKTLIAKIVVLRVVLIYFSI